MNRYFNFEEAHTKAILEKVKKWRFKIIAHFHSGFIGETNDEIYLSLDVLDKCINLINFDRIAHALALTPKVKDTAYTNKLREILLYKIIEKGICIETCPLVFIRSNSIEEYKNAAVHYWMKFKNLKVALGTDGLWTYPTSLSKEIVKLYISDKNFVTLKDYKKICM